MPLRPGTIRLVPEIADWFDACDLFTDKLGWRYRIDETEDISEWEVPGANAIVRWVQDGDTDVEFVVIEGSERESVADLVKKHLDVLTVPDFERYLLRFRSAGGLSQGLLTVGTACPESFDHDGFTIIARHLLHEDSFIRRAALITAGITGWREFIAVIEPLQQDADEAVRKEAAAELEAFSGAS